MSSKNILSDSRLQLDFFLNYVNKLNSILLKADWEKIEILSKTLLDCWNTDKKVFICGNGGSAGNAMHIANDLLYGISKEIGKGLKIHALSSNSSVITCLANDEGYEQIFSHQLAVLGEAKDVLIVLSGSGNSANILNALKVAKEKSILTFGILGYGGGKAKEITDFPIVFPIMDMQISEDLQTIVFHMITQWLYNVFRDDRNNNFALNIKEEVVQLN